MYKSIPRTESDLIDEAVSVPRSDSTTSARSALIASPSARSWPAELDIRSDFKDDRTRVIRCRHSGPLRIQRPFYPEGRDRAHLYLLHPPGGLVCGDHLSISVDTGNGAKVLVTTPSAGKIYRTDELSHRQSQSISLNCQQGTLEWLPQENIVYDGANGEQELSLHTTAQSRFVVWDITAMGRPASQAPFASGRFVQKMFIERDGAPFFHERVALTDQHRLFNAAWGLAAKPVYGSMVAGYTRHSQTVLERLREELANRIPSWMQFQEVASLDWSATRRDDLIILRAQCTQSEPIKRLFEAAWSVIRPEVIGALPCPPRIWST